MYPLEHYTKGPAQKMRKKMRKMRKNANRIFPPPLRGPMQEALSEAIRVAGEWEAGRPPLLPAPPLPLLAGPASHHPPDICDTAGEESDNLASDIGPVVLKGRGEGGGGWNRWLS